MDPLTLIMGGSSILSSILGAGAESDKNKNDWLINYYNQNQRDKERQQGMQYADKIRGEQKLGATDATGNHTHYVEGQGWVTDLGGKNQELLNQFYGNELPEKQSQFRRDATRSRAEDDQATQTLAEYNNVQRDNPTDIENMLLEASNRGISDNTNSAIETAMREALRSGSSNAGNIAAKINAAASKQRGSAARDAKLQASDYADSRYNTRRGQLSQLYQLFAGRAGQPLNPSFDPSSGPSNANALLSQFAGASQQGNGLGANAVARQGGSLAPVEADNSLANMFGGIGASFQGMGDRAQASQSNTDMSDLLKHYITMGGQINLGNGGLFDTIAQRSRYGFGGSTF
jgi:hypothetical protein